MAANDIQVGGQHYAAEVQHWDMVVMHKLNYFEGQITKYVMRARKKNGRQDLEKARHFLEKYLEVYDKMFDGSGMNIIKAPLAGGTLTTEQVRAALGQRNSGLYNPQRSGATGTPHDPLAGPGTAATGPSTGYVGQG